MAGLDREAIYAALKTRLDTLVANPPTTQAPLRALSRRLPASAEPSFPNDQPCLFMPAAREVPEFQPREPYKWTLHLPLIVYARTADAGQAPSSMLTPVVKAIEAALQWQPGDGFMLNGAPTTLGMRCEWCRIVAVEYGEGAATGQGVAVIQLEILAVEDVR